MGIISFFLFFIFFYLILGILVFVLVIQIFKKDSALKIIRPVFWIVSFLILSFLIYISYFQYQAFSQGVLHKTIGTKDGLLWFFNYVRLHFWNQYLVSFLAALGIFALAKYINKKRGGIFFESGEIYLGALGTLLVGYPGFLFYIPIVLIASTMFSAFLVKRGERLPLYYFWMPAAIAVILAIHFWAEKQSWWLLFRF